MEPLIGRQGEQNLLQKAMESTSPELIAIFGRRRVGKTFLVRSFFAQHLAFEFTGHHNDSLRQQLDNFTKSLNKAGAKKKSYAVPETWSDAFGLLSKLLQPKVAKQKTVLFLDEFPWINTHRSGFLAAFDHWWNSWGTRQSNLIVVICGSAASWMIKNVVNSKGGLHNRITLRIRLLPFNLRETELYLHSRKVKLDRYQVLQLYMAIGGIPQYLKEVKKGESATQAIDRICFTKDGLLSGEFKNLYQALFTDATRHMEVVRVLAAKKGGMTRSEIIASTSLSSGGTISGTLEELIESGFVNDWVPYGKKTKDTIYKLSDEFTHFFLKFMEHSRLSGSGTWQSKSNGQSWKSWSGIAFERVCLKHVEQLKKALGIAGVHTEEYAWRALPKSGKGAQIDLLIDRKDFVINLCEMKYSEKEFVIDKGYAGELQNKLQAFRNETAAKKSLFLTLITSFGVRHNDYFTNLVQNSVTMDALFE